MVVRQRGPYVGFSVMDEAGVWHETQGIMRAEFQPDLAEELNWEDNWRHGWPKKTWSTTVTGDTPGLWDLITGLAPKPTYRLRPPIPGFAPGEIQRALDVYFGRIVDPKSTLWAQGDLRSQYEGGGRWATASAEEILRDMRRWIRRAGPSVH